MEVLQAGDAETWHRLCSETFVPLDCDSGDGFVGTIEHLRMDGVSVSRVTCDPCRVGRSRRIIVDESRPDVLLNLIERGHGAVVTTDGHSPLSQGQGALCEADAEYRLELPVPATVLTLQLDRSMLPLADVRIRATHGIPLYDGGRVAVLRHFMTGLFAGASIGAEDDVQYGAVARDLLLLALHAHDDLAAAVEEDSAYVLVRTHLERHFTDPDLSVDVVARRLRVSRRYLENVFARHGRSPAAFLRSLRLDRARSILAGSMTVTISEAARRSGFSDAATFSRAFRRETGLPPAAWRQHAGNDAPGRDAPHVASSSGTGHPK